MLIRQVKFFCTVEAHPVSAVLIVKTRLSDDAGTQRQIGESKAAISSVPHSLAPFATSIGVQPLQQRAHAGPGQGDRAIRSSVVHVDRVTVGIHRVSTGEYDVVNITVALVLRLWPEDPGVSAQQTLLGILKIK
jgi:hypothetical protein